MQELSKVFREKKALKAKIFELLLFNPLTIMFVVAICLDYFGIYSIFGISKIGKKYF